MSCTKIGSICKRAAERIPVSIPLSGSEFIRTWDSGTIYAATQRVRPKKANGYEYECTTAGQSDATQPEWPTTIGGTVIDGSAVWTCRAITSASLTRAITTCVWTGTGLTIDGEMIANTGGESKVSAYIAGGIAGTIYNVIARITFADAAVEEALIELEVE
jgi:hypothetical protein